MSDPKEYPVILLVDDDENDQLFFERAVRKAGFRWRIASVRTGREAMEYLSGSGAFADREARPSPSHVLIDLKLPGISGLEVLEWIRAQPSLGILPVIVLSSSRQSSDLERAKALGIDSYQVKPVEFSALISTVRLIAECWRLDGTMVAPQIASQGG
jgi:CheY-like chemotaxis protein